MYVPDEVLSNKALEQIVDTTDEWILKRTGIAKRRILDKDKPSSYIATQAAKRVLEKTNTDPKDIQLIIGGTNTPDCVFPASACQVAHNIGATRAAAFDIQAACPAFLYALSIATQFITAGTYQKVLVLGFDKMSSIVDYEDRSTCVLFGDGGGAVLLGPHPAYGIQAMDLGSNTAGLSHLCLPAGGSKLPTSSQTLKGRQHYLKQDGNIVYKEACTRMAESSLSVLNKCQLQHEDVDWYLAHQANLRIVNSVAEKIGIDSEKVLKNITRYGNTSAGTIPILMGEYEHLFKKGDKLLLSSFGAGFSWASIYLIWSYNST